MKTQTPIANPNACAGLAAPTGSAHCVRYGCWRMPLKYMKAGESHQTRNGHFSICISGYYCPSCGAGYGGGQ